MSKKTYYLIVANFDRGNFMKSDLYKKLKIKKKYTLGDLKLSDNFILLYNDSCLKEIFSKFLKDNNILYAPDFVINAGGLINVYHELQGYKKENAVNDIEKIYDRLLDIYKLAKENDTHTQHAAKLFAKGRIATISTVRSNFVKR